MKRFALFLIPFFFCGFAHAADNPSDLEHDSYYDVSESDDIPVGSDHLLRFELAMQVLSLDSQVMPMIGPVFGYQLDPRWEVGFKGLFSTRSDISHSTGLGFARFSFDDRPAHFFLEPGIGFQVQKSQVALAGEAELGYEAIVSHSFSVGAATGIDFAKGSSAAPKLVAMTAYRF